MPRKTVLNGREREIIYNVYSFMKKEANEDITCLEKVQRKLKDVQKRTAEATKTPVATVRRILEEETRFQCTPVFVTPGKNRPQAKREIIYDVYCFMKKEADVDITSLGKLHKTFKEVQKRTAEATKTSVATVRRIMKEATSFQLTPVFRTPGKKRPRHVKPVTGVNSFDQGVIKRLIHNFYHTYEEMLTVDKLRNKLREDINFQGSEGSLRCILRNLGFQCRKTENKRRVFIESPNICLRRIQFLKKVKKYRQEGRCIIYTGETYVDSSLANPKATTDSFNKGLKQRLAIVHAGSETGFIPNALLTFQTNSGDYNNDINCKNYEKWLHTQLIPNIPPNSVVVVDNSSSYHNKLYNLAPVTNSKKVHMQAWLTERGIEYDESMLKPELYHLIKMHREQIKTFDKILSDHNHIVLRLPPYHPDLSPIETVWSAIKQYLGSKNVLSNNSDVKDLIKEKVDMMGAQEWQALCKKVRNIEEEYGKSDHMIDRMTEEFTIQDDDDSSAEDSNNDGECEDSDDDVTTVNSASAGTVAPGDHFMKGLFLSSSVLPLY